MWRILQQSGISTQRSCYLEVHQRAASPTQTFGTRWGSLYNQGLLLPSQEPAVGGLHFILETHLASVYNKKEPGHCFGNTVCPHKIVAKLVWFLWNSMKSNLFLFKRCFLSIVALGSQTHLVCPLSFPPLTNTWMYITHTYSLFLSQPKTLSTCGTLVLEISSGMFTSECSLIPTMAFLLCPSYLAHQFPPLCWETAQAYTKRKSNSDEYAVWIFTSFA